MKKKFLALLLVAIMVVSLVPTTVFAGGESYAITSGTPESAKETNHGYIAIDKATAAKNGTVTVTVTPNEGYQLKALTVTPTGFVDLGIKDAEGKPLYWKETNLGASNPQDPGDYYMWGATSLMYSAVDYTKTEGAFTFVTQNPYGDNYKNTWDASLGFHFNNVPFADGVYKNNDGERNVFTKYTTIDKYAKSGTPDNITTLQPEDDAATAKNANWHTPTYDEIVALCKNCVLVWTDNYNSTGNAGYIVYKAKNDADKGKANMNGTGKMWDATKSMYTNTGSEPTGYNTSDIHIFLPAAGSGNNAKLENKNVAGDYYSSNLNTTSRNDYVGNVIFNKSGFNLTYNGFRSYGFSIRPVMSSSGITPAKQTDGTYQFTMPGYAVTVTAEFEEAAPAYTTYENWQIKHEGNSWQWTENLQKVEDGLYKIEINWTGSGFNVASDGNLIKKDWYDITDSDVTIGEEVIPPVTVDVYLRVIDDETLKIGIGVDPAPAPTHNPVLVNGQAATETDAGYKSYYECTHCNKYYEDATGLIEITNLEVWKSKNGNGYIPSGNEINAAKTAAKAALDSENAKDPLTDETSLTNGKSAIDSAETLADIENAKNTAITAINETQATELASAKTAAKAALDAEDAKDPLTDKAPVTTGKANIDAATTKATVESAKNAALEAIRNAQNGNSLATAQAAAQAALDAENAKDPLTDASTVTTGKENISKATTPEEVASAKNAAITAIQTAQASELAAAKTVAKDALDAEDALAPLEDKTPVETGKSNIDAAATKAAVESAKNTAIDAIQEAQAKNPEPAPKPVEVYYAPLVADLKANEDGVIEWEAGDSLPLEAVKLLVDKPELSLEFTFTYEGEEHTIFIPAGAFEKYYDVTIPWYGPAWLIQYFEKSEKEVIEYTIVSGDTLNALAEKFKCTVEEILALNPYISDKHWIYPNNKLLIPVQK